MRKLILTASVVIFSANCALAGTPYKYRSSAIKNKYGHTIGREIESTTSAAKTTQYRMYNGENYSVRTPQVGSLSGGKYGIKPTTRHQAVPPYSAKRR